MKKSITVILLSICSLCYGQFLRAQPATQTWVNSQIKASEARTGKRIDSLVLAFNAYKKSNDAANTITNKRIDSIPIWKIPLAGDLILKKGINGAIDTLATKYIVVQTKDSVTHLNAY